MEVYGIHSSAWSYRDQTAELETLYRRDVCCVIVTLPVELHLSKFAHSLSLSGIRRLSLAAKEFNLKVRPFVHEEAVYCGGTVRRFVRNCGREGTQEPG